MFSSPCIENESQSRYRLGSPNLERRMKPSPCTRTRLSATGVGNVDACSCGMIHVNVGATTLRFTPSSFHSLAALIGRAANAQAAAEPLQAEGARARLSVVARGQA